MPIKLLTSFADSTIATGSVNLLNDICNWLYIIAPIAGGLFCVYFCIRRSGADEQDKKTWTNRVQTAIVSTLGALLATGLIQLISSYFV